MFKQVWEKDVFTGNNSASNNIDWTYVHSFHLVLVLVKSNSFDVSHICGETYEGNEDENQSFGERLSIKGIYFVILNL